MLDKYKTIGDNDDDLFRLADSPEEVIEHIQGYHNKHGLSPNFKDHNTLYKRHETPFSRNGLRLVGRLGLGTKRSLHD